MYILIWVAVLSLSSIVASAINFEPLAKEIGGTFCRYMAYRSLLPKKYFNDCGEQTCTWDDWNSAIDTHKSGSKKERIIVSYAHNGFGNQLWEHSVAFMIAESLKARLLIAVIPDNLSPGGFIPPNTWSGMGAMSRLLPNEFEYEHLPANSHIRTLCDNEKFYVADRPVDFRDKNYSDNFKTNLYNIIVDPKPRCIKLLGYFQNLPLCAEDARRLWTPRLVANFTVKPGPNDVSIYLRCLPRHYYFNDANFYETILDHMSFDRVWLFQAPECPKKLTDNPSKDGIVASVLRLLTTKYNATRWPSYQGTDDTNFLLHDLAGLTQSNKLILPVSSWAFWAGFLSNASEIHVNAPPHHAIMYGHNQYIYHNEKKREFFGIFNSTENDFVFDNSYKARYVSRNNTINNNTDTTSGVATETVPVTVSVPVVVTAAAPAVIEPVKETPVTPYTIHFDIV